VSVEQRGILGRSAAVRHHAFEDAAVLGGRQCSSLLFDRAESRAAFGHRRRLRAAASLAAA